jgi:hypothetical protein
MAASKLRVNLLIAALLVLLLYALNPSKEDFQAWRAARESSRATGDSQGALKKGLGKIAGFAAGLEAGGFERKDYFVCSSYSLDGERYLGVARLFFKLK